MAIVTTDQRFVETIPGQAEQLRTGAPAGDLGDGLQRHAVGRVHVERRDPTPDPTPVQRHADQGPDAHLVPDGIGDQVVERLLDGGLVDDDPGDALRQRPSADLRSSSRGVCSQENSLSGRPKCP